MKRGARMTPKQYRALPSEVRGDIRDALAWQATGPATTTPQLLIIAGAMPGLNDLVALSKQQRGGYSPYNDAKRQWQRNIAVLAERAGLKPVDRARFVFTWIEQRRNRDPDNIAAGGRKLIFDSLVACGILPGDGWRHIAGFEDRFGIDKAAPCVRVEIIPITSETT